MNYWSQIAAVLSGVTTLRRLSLALAMVLAMLAATAGTFPAVIVGKIVDGLESGASAQMLARLVGIVLLALIGSQILKLIQRNLVETTCTAIWRDQMNLVAKALLGAPPEHISRLEAGGVAVIVERGVQARVKLVKLVSVEVFPNICMAAIAVALACMAHISMLMILPLIIGTGAIVTGLQLKSQAGVRDGLERSKASMGAELARLVRGIVYVQASGLKGPALQTIDETASDMRGRELGHHRAMMRFDGVKFTVEGLGLVVLIAVSVWLAQKGAISTGDVVALVILFNKAMEPIQHLHRIVDELQAFSVQSAHVSEIMSIEPVAYPAGQVRIEPAKDIVLQASGLRLRFAGAAGDVLSGIDLTVKMGEWIGIAGDTGSGKSTFLLTCLGIYRDYRGSLQINGTEIRSLPPESISKVVGYCPQEPFIVPGTIRENLLCGARAVGRTPTDEELLEVLECVGLHHRLLKGGRGLDSRLTEFGSDVSGGQRQLMMIARALLCNCDIYLFDESTSALDAAAEQHLLEGLKKRLAGKTCLFISHRPSPFEFVDRTILFGAGRKIDRAEASAGDRLEAVSSGG